MTTFNSNDAHATRIQTVLFLAFDIIIIECFSARKVCVMRCVSQPKFKFVQTWKEKTEKPKPQKMVTLACYYYRFTLWTWTCFHLSWSNLYYNHAVNFRLISWYYVLNEQEKRANRDDVLEVPMKNCNTLSLSSMRKCKYIYKYFSDRLFWIFLAWQINVSAGWAKTRDVKFMQTKYVRSSPATSRPIEFLSGISCKRLC